VYRDWVWEGWGINGSMWGFVVIGVVRRVDVVAVRGGLWWFSGCLVVGWGVRSLRERGRRGGRCCGVGESDG
jgi:hypothetical protein